jgi:hypothetical protein
MFVKFAIEWDLDVVAACPMILDCWTIQFNEAFWRFLNLKLFCKLINIKWKMLYQAKIISRQIHESI